MVRIGAGEKSFAAGTWVQALRKLNPEAALLRLEESHGIFYLVEDFRRIIHLGGMQLANRFNHKGVFADQAAMRRKRRAKTAGKID